MKEKLTNFLVDVTVLILILLVVVVDIITLPLTGLLSLLIWSNKMFLIINSLLHSLNKQLEKIEEEENLC